MHVSHLVNLNALNYHCNLILIIRFCTWLSRVWISSILCLRVETVWCNMLCIWGCTRLKFRRCHLILFHLNKSILKYYTYMCDNQMGLIRYVWLEIWGQLRRSNPGLVCRSLFFLFLYADKWLIYKCIELISTQHNN